MSAPVSQSMFLEPVSELTVIETSKKLKSKSNSGHDEIYTNVLKETIDIVIKPITHFVNRSFDVLNSKNILYKHQYGFR